MSPAVSRPPFKATAWFRKMSVDEFEQLIEAGKLTDEDRVELLEGYMVYKMPRNPPHDGALNILTPRLIRVLPPGWVLRNQSAARLADSRPEPDFAIARGNERDYFHKHPTPADLGLVVEVADSSLDRDQLDKTRIYARDRIPVYWVVNLIDRRVEVYTDPTGPGDDPRYHTLRVFGPGSAVPVELDGATVGTIPVDELMP